MGKDVKLTLNPAQEIVAKAKAETVVTDSEGRAIVLKKPGVLAQYRLVEALGDSARNEVYMGMCLPLLYVGSIAGEPVFSPNKKSEVEALIQRLDEHGVAAVVKGVNEHFGTRDPEADKAAVKN